MVWWFTRKMAKPVKGHHFQRYKHITRLFPYDVPIISLVVPYYFPSFPLLFPIVSIISLLVPYFCPIISLCIYIYNLLILPYYCPICLPGFQNDKLRHLE